MSASVEREAEQQSSSSCSSTRRRNVWCSTSLLFFLLPYSPFFPPSRLYTPPALFPQSWGRGFDKFITFGAYRLQSIIFKYGLLNLEDDFRCGFLNSSFYLVFSFSALFFRTLCPAPFCLQLRASPGEHLCRRTLVVCYSHTWAWGRAAWGGTAALS